GGFVAPWVAGANRTATQGDERGTRARILRARGSSQDWRYTTQVGGARPEKCPSPHTSSFTITSFGSSWGSSFSFCISYARRGDPHWKEFRSFELRSRATGI